ncbi:MAG TPA: histidinol-phosphate transaminase, partial [Gammaproteobacteria bacterium]|nr:histidinol-phosphate transaminase [Gammaproteobacteria bacterium]
DLPAMAAAITAKTKVVFIANPNNPTGTSFGRSEWEAFISAVPESVLVVLDEAY